jgi:hypothetical protein
MNTFPVSILAPASWVDETVIRLRKRGFTAYSESSECGKKLYVVTDAPRSVVLMEAGRGGFLD